MMTRRLPKIAAKMIKIIIKAVKTVIKTLIHSWSIISSVLVLLRLLIVALEIEKVTAFVTNSFIVRVCSLLINDEEDDNFGDNVWDDMVGGVYAFTSFSKFLSSFFSTSFSYLRYFESTREQIKSQQFFLSLRCKNKAFMFRFTMVCYKLQLVGIYYCLIWLNCACELITWFPPEIERD